MCNKYISTMRGTGVGWGRGALGKDFQGETLMAGVRRAVQVLGTALAEARRKEAARRI